MPNSQTSTSFLESTVNSNREEIQAVRSKVETLESKVSEINNNQQLTNQTIEFFTNSMAEVKTTTASLTSKLDNEMKELQRKLDTNNTNANEKMNTIIKNANDNQIEQLKEYKSIMWKVGGAVLTAVVVGATTLFIGM